MKRTFIFFSVGLVVTLILISFSRGYATDEMNKVDIIEGQKFLDENGLKNFKKSDGSLDLNMLHVHPKVKRSGTESKFEAEVYGSIFVFIIGLILGIYWRRVSYDDVVAMALPSLLVVLINVASVVIISPYLLFLAFIWIYKSFFYSK